MAKLEKQAKNKEKLQEKVDREKKKLSDMERERNAIQERLNSTKCFDELNEDESHLNKLNEEDQAIIDDANASESDKQAAEERMADRNEELASWRDGGIDVSCCRHYNRGCCWSNTYIHKLSFLSNFSVANKS